MDEESMRKMNKYDQSIVIRSESMMERLWRGEQANQISEGSLAGLAGVGDATLDMLQMYEASTMSNPGSLISNSVLGSGQSPFRKRGANKESAGDVNSSQK